MELHHSSNKLVADVCNGSKMLKVKIQQYKALADHTKRQSSLTLSFRFSASSSSSKCQGTRLTHRDPPSPSPLLSCGILKQLPSDDIFEAFVFGPSSLIIVASICSFLCLCLPRTVSSSPHLIGTGVPPVPTEDGRPGSVDAAAPYLTMAFSPHGAAGE